MVVDVREICMGREAGVSIMYDNPLIHYNWEPAPLVNTMFIPSVAPVRVGFLIF